MSIPAIPPDALAGALDDARKLAGMGVPIFCARLMPDGDPDRRDKRWLGWQKTEPGPESMAAVESWKPGYALCAVMGVKCDALDPDLYKPDGKESFDILADALGENGPEVWWEVATPSGGRHYLIDRTGLGSHNGILPGLDIKGGREDGTSRGFIFIPPTMRPSKVTGEVRSYRPVSQLRKMNGHGNVGPIRRYLAMRLNGSDPGDGLTGGGSRKDPDALREACLAAEDGEQRVALMGYAGELQKRGYARSDILILLRSVCSDQRWRTFDDKQPWFPAKGGDPDRHLKSLLYPDGKIIPDANPAELEFLNDFEPAPPKRPGLSTLTAVPEYPVAEGVLGKLIRSARNLPPAIVGGAGLAALAAACSGWSLEMPDGSSQYPVVWIPLMAPRGAGKSPALDLAFEDIRELDNSSWRDFQEEVMRYRKLSKDERESAARPSDPSILLDDFTVEHLARMLSSGDERACVVSDELSGWLRGLGRYGRGGGSAEVSRMLSLWSSSPWKYGRVSGETSLLIMRPVVSIVGGIQPHLHGLLGDDETGMRPRWLPHYVSGWEADWGTARAPKSWVTRVTELYVGKGRTLILDGPGLEEWNACRSRWRESSRGSGISDTVHGALAKADLQCARIALILAAASGETESVSAGAVSAAASIVDYCVGVWAALPSPDVFARSEAERIMRRSTEILRTWLERHGGQATRSSIQKAQVAGVVSAKDCSDLIKAYNAVYPGCVRKVRTGKRGPATEVIVAPDRAP